MVTLIIRKVLTEALRKFEGAVLVISHDRTFLDELEPTHIITVRGIDCFFCSEISLREVHFNLIFLGGKVAMEERGLVEGDWNDPLDSRGDGCSENGSEQKFATTAAAAVATKSGSTMKLVVDDDTRKKILNAPKRIKKIENALEKHESEVSAIDAAMLQVQTEAKPFHMLVLKVSLFCCNMNSER